MTATQSNKAPVKAGLLDRLKSGPVICAEGYLFELERRGYLQAGAFVPEAVVENPEVVKRLHEDFVHAGSDVVEAFTYYAHRQKLRVIGRENVLEDINRQALRIARDVADRHGWVAVMSAISSIRLAHGILVFQAAHSLALPRR